MAVRQMDNRPSGAPGLRVLIHQPDILADEVRGDDAWPSILMTIGPTANFQSRIESAGNYLLGLSIIVRFGIARFGCCCCKAATMSLVPII